MWSFDVAVRPGSNFGGGEKSFSAGESHRPESVCHDDRGGQAPVGHLHRRRGEHVRFHPVDTKIFTF